MSFLAHMVGGAIGEAECSKEPIVGPPGYTGERIRRLLSILCRCPGAAYLEVGLFRGATFCSAIRNNAGVRAVGVDIEIKDECRKAVEEHSGTNTRVGLFETSFFADKFNYLMPFKPNIYFYDGPHTQDEHRKAVVTGFPMLQDEFVYLVDDWNWDMVQNGTRQGFLEAGLLPARTWELGKDEKGAAGSWWNGLFVGVFRRHS